MVNKLLKIGGIIFFSFIILFVTYYFSSGMNERFGPKKFFLKTNKVIFKKYLGVDLVKFDDYFDIVKIKIKSSLIKPQVEKIKLDVKQKTILYLEQQRKLRINKQDDQALSKMHNTIIKYNKKKLKAKIRVKGDRSMHWNNKKTTSFKIDMRGGDRIWGLEEFSIQKPITRNYIYEYLFHKFLGETNQLNLKYFFVNLYFNDEDRGLYAVEESFSKELLERQKKEMGQFLD